MTIIDGGPAFPRSEGSSDARRSPKPNQADMSLRDWFAGQALVGILSAATGPREGFAQFGAMADYVAPESYKVADAMLAVQEKTAG